jgi:hypothetical protein
MNGWKYITTDNLPRCIRRLGRISTEDFSHAKPHKAAQNAKPRRTQSRAERKAAQNAKPRSREERKEGKEGKEG